MIRIQLCGSVQGDGEEVDGAGIEMEGGGQFWEGSCFGLDVVGELGGVGGHGIVGADDADDRWSEMGGAADGEWNSYRSQGWIDDADG